MNSDFSSILAQLADGVPISVDALAQRLSWNRSAVLAAVSSLQTAGLQLQMDCAGAVTWHAPTYPLSRTHIMAGLAPEAAGLIDALEVHFTLDSTNQYLLRQPSEKPGAQVCLAESQTAGRGRRGKQWISPPCCNLYLSVRQSVPVPASGLNGLSLGAGLMVIEALTSLLPPGTGLKWPNDLYVHNRKLGGILVEIPRATRNACDVIVGIGLNVLMPDETANIDQPWTSLNQHLAGTSLDRNNLAARILDRLLPFLQDYPAHGQGYIAGRWPDFDLTLGQPVSVLAGDRVIHGIGAGVDAQFHFRLAQANGTRSYASGEVSLRTHNQP